MSVTEAIILAIIEGLTEFLPVSSTGHIMMGSSAMGIAALPFTKVFTISIQFGAIFSVVILYWKRFFQSITFYLKLFVAFLPAAIIGLALGDFIDTLLERVDVVGYTLIAGGLVFLVVDKIFEKNERDPHQEVSYIKAVKIGLFQCLAMVPGVSRSAATIIGGLTQKMNKKTAAEFSFFLAVPTLFAATVYKLYTYLSGGLSFTSAEINLLLVGNIVSFIVAILAIRSFIGFLTNHGFRLFGYYRIIAGAVILFLYYFGADLSLV